MKLEVISHCWRYSRLLTYQLSSLVLFPPSTISVTMTVFCSESDLETRKVLDHFSALSPTNVTWNWWRIETPRLMRRAIGRNLAARNTEADWVWFADCDMAFGVGALDSLREAIGEVDWQLAYLRSIQLQKTHDLGDRAITRVSGPQVVALDPQEFSPHRYRRAIGGVQIVQRDIARRLGYCDTTRWQRPAEQFQRCREDVAYRRILHRQLAAR